MASFGGHFLFCHVVADPDSPTHQGEHEIHYYGFGRPSFRNFQKEGSWRVEVIDTWEMTVTDLGIFSGNFRVPLPGKEYMAIRLRKVWQKGSPTQSVGGPFQNQRAEAARFGLRDFSRWFTKDGRGCRNIPFRASQSP